MSVFRAAGMRSVSKQIAHTAMLPALGNKDLRHLQDLINLEKNVVSGAQKLADDLARANEALKQWGIGEGDDLGDVLSQCREIMMFVSAALAKFSQHETAIRVHMKAVRTREENLDELRRRRKQVGSKAESAEKKLSKMGPENKSLQQQTDLLHQLRVEMQQLDMEIMAEEARLWDYKRQTTKDWMALKFGGLVEMAEKIEIVGNVGKQMIEEIPLDQTTPGQPHVQYMGHQRTQQLLGEASQATKEVVFQPTTGNLAFQYEPGGPQPTSPTLQHQQQDPIRPPMRQGSFNESARSYSGLPIPMEPEPRRAESFGSAQYQFNEFGAYPNAPPQAQAQSLGPSGPGAPYPPRTSSTRTEPTGPNAGANGGRFATFPNRTGVWDGPQTAEPAPMGSPEIPKALPSPAVPPKEDSFAAVGDRKDPSLFAEKQEVAPVPEEPSRDRFEAHRSQSGLSDTAADLVLSYYHSQDEREMDTIEEDRSSRDRAASQAQHGRSPASGDFSDEDPYAADAFASASPEKHNFTAEQLGLKPVEPLHPRSIQDLNAVAAQEIAKELNLPSGGPSGRRPPPRSSSKGYVVAPADTSPQPPMPAPPAAAPPLNAPPPSRAPGDIKLDFSPPPSLSLDFNETKFDFNVGGEESAVPEARRERSPPPSFEDATSQPASPHEKQASIPRELPAPPQLPQQRQQSPQLPQQLPPQRQGLPPSPQPHQFPQPQGLALPGGPLGRSTSNLSTASTSSSLSTLPHPNPPFMATSPTRGTTTTLPTESGLESPGKISAAAFKKFRSPSASTTGSTGSMTTRKQAPPLTGPNFSATSGISTYVSAPSSPQEVPADPMPQRSSWDSKPTNPANYAPSPLSVPYNAGAPQPGMSRVSYMSTFSASPYDGDPSNIGLAVGSPSTPHAETFNVAGNRMTIGDQGWQPVIPGREGQQQGRSVSDGSQRHDEGGYGRGQYATSLE